MLPSHPEPVNIEGNAEVARVVGLLPWMDYEFQVVASNILGSGLGSDSIMNVFVHLSKISGQK